MISDWLKSTATYTCSETVANAPTVTNDFPAGGITAGTTTVKFTATNNCATSTLVKTVKVCPCPPACPYLRSQGYWQNHQR
jgi:hypothetical protein